MARKNTKTKRLIANQLSDQELNSIMIRLYFDTAQFGVYAEDHTALDILREGTFVMTDIQACIDHESSDQGRSYIPDQGNALEVLSMHIVTEEDEPLPDPYDNIDDDMSHWQYEIAREAGAMYGRQAYYDRLGFQFNVSTGGCSRCFDSGCGACCP